MRKLLGQIARKNVVDLMREISCCRRVGWSAVGIFSGDDAFHDDEH